LLSRTAGSTRGSASNSLTTLSLSASASHAARNAATQWHAAFLLRNKPLDDTRAIEHGADYKDHIYDGILLVLLKLCTQGGVNRAQVLLGMSHSCAVHCLVDSRKLHSIDPLATLANFKYLRRVVSIDG
jgi:hypothetical protein